MHPALRVRHLGGWLDRPTGSTGEAEPEVMPPISMTPVSLYVTDDRRRHATAPLLCLNSEILTTIRREFLEGSNRLKFPATCRQDAVKMPASFRL
jgi:hypothetical protein